MSYFAPIAYTPGKLISATSTNATVVKAAPGVLGYVVASNTAGAPRWIKLYNKASNPAVGTDIPVATLIVPGNLNGAGTNIHLPGGGMSFTNGIAFAITGANSDADATAIGAGEVVVNYGFN